VSADGWGRWVKAEECKEEHPFMDLDHSWMLAAIVGEHLHWEPAPDQKYIVFKREDLANSYGDLQEMEFLAIYDAVVIRTQDVIAGPALHTYAANIGLVATILEEVDAPKALELSNIADYFHFRALEADDGSQKLPGF
jgi:hypothetical protein